MALYNANDVPVGITKTVNEVVKNRDVIFVPYSKAVAQFAVEYIPDVEIVEVDANKIKNLKTERGEGMLGSSNK